MESWSQAPSLADLSIVIIGGTSGIGRAIASAFVKEARGIVVFGRRAENPGVLEEFAGAGNVLAVAGDITVPKDVQALSNKTLARFGRIDALINCAGIFPKAPFLSIPHEHWQATIETNLVGYALACRSVLPHMIASGFGRIVNISSRLAANPSPQTSAYTVSKAGANQLMKCLALEMAQLGHRNILINDLIPGHTKTGMSNHGQDPALVVPFARELMLLPLGGPTGKTYFRGQIYDLLGAS